MNENEYDLNGNHNIKDFGKYIGGSKKEIALLRKNLLEADIDEYDLDSINQQEADVLIIKKNIWAKPDYESMVADGMDKNVAYFIKTIYDGIMSKPVPKADDSKHEGYIKFVKTIQKMVANIQTVEDCKGFQDKIINAYLQRIGIHSYSLVYSYDNYMTNKLFKASRYSEWTIREKVKKTQFCYTEQDKINSIYKISELKESEYQKTWNYDDSESIKYIKLITSSGTNYYYIRNNENNNINSISDIFNNPFVVLNKANASVVKAFVTKEQAEEYVKQLYNKEMESTKTTESSSKKRKIKYVPEHLANIERIGKPIDKEIDTSTLLSTYQFYGGEFGNWVSDNERTINLKMAYEAFSDLAQALNIRLTDVSFEQTLSIAFGSRGSGSALAHYEPLRQVINLTKMKGAGSLGHEWIHALDDYVGTKLNISGLMSDNKFKDNVPKCFVDLLNTICKKPISKDATIKLQEGKIKEKEKQFELYVNRFVSDRGMSSEQKQKLNEYISIAISEASKTKEPLYKESVSIPIILGKIGELQRQATGGICINEKSYGFYILGSYLNEITEANNQYMLAKEGKLSYVGTTKFYEDAKQLDEMYAKMGHGYWSSDCELLARAGACYIEDKLKDKNMKNDYLCGHATSPAIIMENGENVFMNPQGKEREDIDKAFDKFFDYVKEKGFLHNQEYDQYIVEEKIEPKQEQVKHIEQVPKKEAVEYKLKTDENGQYTLF